jgi:hypothetical protein
VGLSPLGTSATIWPIVPAPDEGWWWAWSNRWKDWQGKPKYWEETRPIATLFTTNHTWPVPRSIQATAVGTRLTAWVMVRPRLQLTAGICLGMGSNRISEVDTREMQINSLLNEINNWRSVDYYHVNMSEQDHGRYMLDMCATFQYELISQETCFMILFCKHRLVSS